MKLPSPSHLLFSAKCFVAAMLALYIAMASGLPRPFWAMMTAYIVANPFAGAVRSKAIYRVFGTILGSLFTILIVPQLANAPELLSSAIALWVGLCLYISLLDRTPRSYVFMLAGYTAGLIGFPAVSRCCGRSAAKVLTGRSTLLRRLRQISRGSRSNIPMATCFRARVSIFNCDSYAPSRCFWPTATRSRS